MGSVYTALDSACGQIRLLDLLPGHFDDILVVRLRPVSLRSENVSAYEALSYVWGTDASTGHVDVNEQASLRLPITGNLKSALQHLRQPDRIRTLWVDALCINQSDVQERGSQVQLMAQIYTAASQVIIWLGPEEDGGTQYSWSTMSDDFENMSSALWKHDRQKYEVYINEVSRTIYHILERPWFERTWVVQEAALSKADPVLTVGHHVFSWNQFSKNSAKLEYNDYGNLFGVNRSSYRNRQDYAYNITIMRAAVQNPTRQNTGSFAYQLQRTLRSLATDPRDKVFGVLGITKFEADRLLPDYTKSIKEVFAEATAFMLRHGYLSIYFDAP